MKFARNAFIALWPALLAAQTLDLSLLLKPPTNAWPTYNGDYSGRRSALYRKSINRISRPSI